MKSSSPVGVNVKWEKPWVYKATTDKWYKSTWLRCKAWTVWDAIQRFFGRDFNNPKPPKHRSFLRPPTGILGGLIHWTDLTVTTGRELIVDAIQAYLTTPYIGWGTGTTNPVAGDADLETPASPVRVAATPSQPVATTYQVVAEITAGGSLTISEAGLFASAGSGNPPTGGIMVSRSVFTGIPLNSGDKIAFTGQIPVTA